MGVRERPARDTEKPMGAGMVAVPMLGAWSADAYRRSHPLAWPRLCPDTELALA